MKALFLVGFMGSGKSTLGKKLAEELNWDFFDLDEVVESDQKQKIPDLFRNLGEARFRKIEMEALRRFEKMTSPFVLATGGGTPCFNENMDWMKEHGEVLFLDLAPEELVERLKGDRSNRPVLNALDPGKFDEEMLILLGKRRPFYLQAPWILGKNVQNIAEVIHMLNS